MQIADPPNLPLGTSHLYINYDDIEARNIGVSGRNSVWFTIAQSGEIDLQTVVNKSVSLGSANVATGNFDTVRISISSAIATFGGKNYTVIGPVSEVEAPIIQGGITLATNGGSAGIVLQFSPTLVAEENNGTPTFAASFGAQAIPIPTTDWNAFLASKASGIDILSKSWWNASQIQLPGNVVFISDLMSYNSLLLVLKNTGNTSVSLSGISIIKQLIVGGGPDTMQTVATFLILSNSSLVQPGAQLIQLGQGPTWTDIAR